MSAEPFRIAFTGHRPDKLGGYQPNGLQTAVRQALFETLANAVTDGPVVAMSGMALGLDTWAAEACVELGIPFIAAVPFKGQESRWPRRSQDIYKTLLDKAQEVVVVSPGSYSARAMHRRNEYMVDWAHRLVAVWDGSPGGTAACVAYARKKGRIMHNLWRNEWETERRRIACCLRSRSSSQRP